MSSLGSAPATPLGFVICHNLIKLDITAIVCVQTTTSASSFLTAVCPESPAHFVSPTETKCQRVNARLMFKCMVLGGTMWN